MNMRQIFKNKWVWIGVVGFLGVIWLMMQFVPMEKSNPAVAQEPNWDSPETRALAKSACFDCHSNETVYPWYADIAPMRLLVRNHVLEGREILNFSEWDNTMPMDEIEEVINEGEMPPWDYVLLHPEARLTDEEKDALINGLRQTVTNSGGNTATTDAEDEDEDD